MEWQSFLMCLQIYSTLLCQGNQECLEDTLNSSMDEGRVFFTGVTHLNLCREYLISELDND